MPNITYHKGNIFNLLDQKVCDGIIVFGSGLSTDIGTDWRIFRLKFPDLVEQFRFHDMPWVKVHSRAIPIVIDQSLCYVYFLKNEDNKESIGDFQLISTLDKAVSALIKLGCKSIGFNGARPIGFAQGLPTDNQELRDMKRFMNINLYRNRVDLICSFFQKNFLNQNVEIHLVSKNDVFMNPVTNPFLNQS